MASPVELKSRPQSHRSALESSTANLKEASRQTRIIGVANQLAKQGVRALAVDKDPDSSSYQLALALNKTGVKRDILECDNDEKALMEGTVSTRGVAAVVALEEIGTHQTILLASGKNVLDVIRERRARCVIPPLPVAFEDGREVLMAVIAHRPM